MFKHTHNPEEVTDKSQQAKSVSLDVGSPLIIKSKTSDEAVYNNDIKSLIEKNLKWSQIIYEQNRKINSKLFWAAIAGWVRVALILIPIVLGILFLSPLLTKVVSQYSDLLGVSSASISSTPQSSLDNLFTLFNVDPAKQEQIKALLK
jgi:hypothetical protein